MQNSSSSPSALDPANASYTTTPTQHLNSVEDDTRSVASISSEVKPTKNVRQGSAHRGLTGRRIGRPSLAGRIRQKSRDPSSRDDRAGGRVGTNDATSAPRSKTHLVLSGQPTGWTAMAHAVRIFDEEKVRDCKEDVDTLLVFAGLFSAVLTAFLIESYKNLLEDPAKQTLVAIRQLVLQSSSYQIQGGTFNSTAPSFLVEPFQASTADIRVNVLWFASLLFSLITASFGILVKQWLREFLAAENPSPQARLRVRHLRYPELSRWKVFEIAAVLPLLLQLALALFFAGLCYFTASVHSSVEYTTLPLVLGWTFCFCTVCILTLIFPRCPYRTALLKNWVQSLHRGAGRVTTNIATYCRAGLRRSISSSSNRLKRMMFAGTEKWFKRWSLHLTEQDELRVMRCTDKDIEILGTVDSIQSDDELLGTAIAEAVDHLNCESAQFEEFLRTVLENRGHPSLRVINVPPSTREQKQIRPFPLPILDLGVVSKQARNAICTIVSHYATNARYEAGTTIPNAMSIDFDLYATILMCMIMLSISDCPLPEDGLYIIKGPHFHAHGVRAMRSLMRSALAAVAVGYDSYDKGYEISEDKARLLLRGLGRLWDHLDVGTRPLIMNVYVALRLCSRKNGDDNDISDFFKWNRVDEWTLDHLSPGRKCDLMGLLLKGTASVMRNGPEAYAHDDFDLETILRAILRLSYSTEGSFCDASDAKAFDFILTELLTKPAFTLLLVNSLIQAPLSCVKVFTDRFPGRFVVSPNPTYGVDMVAFDWCALLDNYIEAVLAKLSDTTNQLSNVAALKLCYFSLGTAMFLVSVQPPPEKWINLFTLLLDRIDGPTSEPREDINKAKSALADSMLELICYSEKMGFLELWASTDDEHAYADWANVWREDTAIIPDGLIESIAPYVPRKYVSATWRVRRASEARRAKSSTVQVTPSICSSDDSSEVLPVPHIDDATQSHE